MITKDGYINGITYYIKNGEKEYTISADVQSSTARLTNGTECLDVVLANDNAGCLTDYLQNDFEYIGADNDDEIPTYKFRYDDDKEAWQTWVEWTDKLLTLQENFKSLSSISFDDLWCYVDTMSIEQCKAFVEVEVNKDNDGHLEGTWEVLESEGSNCYAEPIPYDIVQGEIKSKLDLDDVHIFSKSGGDVDYGEYKYGTFIGDRYGR